jgi:hypothetical protein
MTEMYVLMPGYFDEIVQIVSERDWLIHNFNTNDLSSLYNPADYLYNSELEGVTYRAVLDLNIFQFLVNSTKKKRTHDTYRAALALLVLCQIAEIEMDPTFAVYERINYNGEYVDEALAELELFHNINNARTDALARYALGALDNIELENKPEIDRDSLRNELLRYRRLKDWDSLYLMVLAIIHTYYEDSIPHAAKLTNFVDWLLREFRLSLPVIVFATRLFGKNPLKRMMKVSPVQGEHERRSAAFNMTWDLYLMTRFFAFWTNKTETEEYIFVSDDNALRSVLRLAISVQQQGGLEPLQSYLNPRVWGAVRALLDGRQNRTDRIYGTGEWNPDHRKKLIDQFECSIFS